MPTISIYAIEGTDANGDRYFEVTDSSKSNAKRQFAYDHPDVKIVSITKI